MVVILSSELGHVRVVGIGEGVSGEADSVMLRCVVVHCVRGKRDRRSVVLNQDIRVVSVREEILGAGSALAESSRAVSLIVSESDTLTKSDIIEVMITDIIAIDLEAVSVLPSVSNLQVADPSVAIKGTLLFLSVERVNIAPACVVRWLSLDALVRQVVEVAAEVCLEHRVACLDHVAVEQVHEVLTADIVDSVANVLVMLMDLHATSGEQVWDVILTEESLCDLEASSTTEGSEDVTDTNDSMSDHTMVITKHSRSDGIDWHDLAWADLGILHVDAVTQEELVHLLDFLAGAKDALMAPVVLQVISADPLARVLVLVGQSSLEAIVQWQV